MTTVRVSASPEKKLFPITSPNGHRGQQGSASSTSDQHPYAIKTTSTAVLTRSNSTGYAASHQHVYIPSTPSPASKHRHSKSDLSRPSPRPLPIPPSFESPTKSHKGHTYTSSQELVFPLVRARADTLPHTPSPSLPSPVKVDELPSNPRVWTTSQLASYLITALRVRSGESLPLPLPVAKDIAAFVKEARLNGRAFLRLNEQDLESMGVNNLWRQALLTASRNLRQNVLKGRIWGFADDDIVEQSHSLPLRNFYNSSSSSVDETLGSQESTPHKRDDRKGRVRGLIASLELTSSTGSGFSNHGSSTSEGDFIPAWADEEAAFASGSDASEVEDRKARAVTKKRLFPEPIPPSVAGAVQGAGQSSINASPEEEPTVEDLLISDSLSGNWGAKAWEGMNIGDTVKHVGHEHGSESARNCDDVSTRPENASKSASGKHSNSRKGDPLVKAKDIFTRPLPSRPLPSPPKSGLNSPLLTAPPAHVAWVDRSVQADSELSDSLRTQGKDQNVREASVEDSEKLRHAFSLLEQYRQRLAELEWKLSLLESIDAEQEHVEHLSQGIETDALPPAPIAIGTDSMESRRFIPGQVQTGRDDSAFTRSSGGQEECGADSTRSLQRSSISAEDTDDSASPRSRVGPKWPGQRKFDGRDWDPLENGLSSYLLMVSVGVCAVVLSTILKRLAGKKA